MQYMLSLENSLIEAIQWLIIFISSYLLWERVINRFYHEFANFDGLKKRQLWFNPCYYWLAHKNGLLQASKGHYWCPSPCRNYHQCSGKALESPKLNYH